MTAFTGAVVMWFNRGKEGEEEVRGIIHYSGEKLLVCFITYAGNGGIVFAVAEPGAAAVKCLQATTIIRLVRHS